MEIAGNRLVIIGNGFDLAHGLKTGYKDFVTSYLEKMRFNFKKDPFGFRGDDLITIQATRYLPQNQEYSSDIFTWIEKYNATNKNHTNDQVPIKVNIKSVFFQNIYNKVKLNWVDIENEYFKALLTIHKRDVAASENRSFNAKKYAKYNVSLLNKEFECLRSELLDYLRSINKSEVYDEFLDFLDHGTNSEQLFLSFNYTDTIKKYLTKIRNRAGIGFNTSLVYIHGSLADDNNGEPIFGLGDEHHSDLATFKESDNLTELYRFSKSNLYFLESNYKYLKSFLSLGNYTVEILGSSCGLSDRTLFKEILDNEMCKSITVYHHLNRDDYFKKTIELHRHFDDPQNLRDKMKEYDIDDRIPMICLGLKDIEKRLLKVS